MKLRRRHQELTRPPATLEAATVLESQAVRLIPSEHISPKWHKEILRQIHAESTLSAGTSVFSYMLIFPDRLADMGSTDEDWLELKKTMDERRDTTSTYFELARNAAILFPERRAELGLNDDDEIALSILIDSSSSRGQWEYCAQEAVCAKILYPDQDDSRYINESLRQGLLKDIARKRQRADLFEFANLAMQYKLLFPDQIDDLCLDAEIWKRLAVDFVDLAGNENNYTDATMFVEFAAPLAVLAADEVRLSGAGVDLIYKKPLEDMPELPDRNLS